MKKPGREHFKKTKQNKRIKITGGRGISEGKRNGQLMSARKSENRCILYVTVINSTREYMIEKSHKKTCIGQRSGMTDRIYDNTITVKTIPAMGRQK